VMTLIIDEAEDKKKAAIEKERSGIEPMATLAIEALKPYGKPKVMLTGQQKVSVNCAGDGWKLPVIGFLDIEYPDQGLVIDLKTTLRMPSKMSAGHIRQRCVYARCKGNSVVQFLYVTPKKVALLEDGNVDEELAKIKAILNRTERFLTAGDRDFLASIVPVNPNTFYWRDAGGIRSELFDA